MQAARGEAAAAPCHARARGGGRDAAHGDQEPQQGGAAQGPRRRGQARAGRRRGGARRPAPPGT